MGSFFEQHRRFILVLVLLILFLSLINLVEIIIPAGILGEGLVADLLSPLLRGVSSIRSSFTGAASVVFNYKETREENINLIRENKKLKWQLQELAELSKENQRLRELLNFEQRDSFQFLGAKVIGRSASNWSEVVTINRGSRSGLEPKMLVVTYNGHLIGKVEKVSAYSAQVLLITDYSFTIGGLVSREESREIGIVQGTADNKELLRMDKLPWDADIIDGDEIITSGLSADYPKGISIGEVQEVEAEDHGLSRSAVLKPLVDLRTFEEVLVITDF
ncbi:rod shape-determining protein MreC [Fuchsiella alkaliacetigena]|uniref:rod shape-determining protein MreC n=1 Tax=Fuchsiella alkaliacetigena TaxID=957042 RepID=UPI002009EAA2|nr:rod shape-determining protein MreC [Fuchsiella alkaliacetigena]MCK8825600.1 rod shape-determining protein MreC [Fuchsiella alkaliacetigena]